MKILKVIWRWGWHQIDIVLDLLQRFINTPRKRYTWIGLFLSIGLIIVFTKIFVTTYGPNGRVYRAMGNKLYLPKEITLSPTRGGIYANDGRPVAVTTPVYQLFFDFRAQALRDMRLPDSIAHKSRKKTLLRDSLRVTLPKQMEQFADELVRMYSTPKNKINKKLLLKRWKEGLANQSRRCPVLHRDVSFLEYEQLRSIPPLCAELDDKGRAVRTSFISKLIYTEERVQRINPFGSLGLRTIGAVYADQEKGGRSGLELYYDSLLRGQTGRGLMRYNAGQYNQSIITPAIDGADVYTTLDMNKQNTVEGVMRKQLEYLGAESGTAILMEVKTGKILSITNLGKSPRGGYWETQNFAVSDLSEPGSTFKVASMMVALEDHKIRPTDNIDVGNGLWTYAKRVVRDHNAHRGGYGRITASQVIEKSSNVGIAKIITRAYDSHPDEYVQKVRDLAFGYDFHLEIPGAEKARIRKRADNPNRWYGTTLAWMSFGYETQVPPIYTVAFFNAIANGGKLVRPYFVSKIVQDGDEVLHHDPIVIKDSICSRTTLLQIQDMLRKVVQQGTGRSLRSDIVSISGKSGTAQLAVGGGYKGAHGVSHQVSFCGYFPSENPKYTCMVVIRNPDKKFSAGGGSMAGPVVREIAEEMMAMEDPMPTDSLRQSDNPLAYKYSVQAGQKGQLSTLLSTLGLRYQSNEKLSASQFISVDSIGQEHPLPHYPSGVVPQVVGLGAMDANYLILSSGYVPVFTGYGRVVAQSVAAGTKLARGNRIQLTLQ